MTEGAQLVRYDAMCRAIAAAHAVDEVKDIRDKARAIEMYARQAQNTEAERQAIQIRLRAERRCGEILAERDMARAGRPPVNRSDDVTDYRGAETLADLGVSKQQSSDWQRIATIPAQDFESDLADPMWRPTTSGLIERAEARERGPLPQLAVDDGGLWLWGRLQEFKRDGLLERDPKEVVEGLPAHMQDTVNELAPQVACWLQFINGG